MQLCKAERVRSKPLSLVFSWEADKTQFMFSLVAVFYSTSFQQLPANHNKSLLKRRHHFHSGLKTEFTKHINFNVRRLNRDELDSRTSCYLRCSAKWPPGRSMTVNLHESPICRKLASILHGTLPGGALNKILYGEAPPRDPNPYPYIYYF